MARLLVFPRLLPPTTTNAPPHCHKQELEVDANSLSPITRIQTQSYALLGAEPTKRSQEDSFSKPQRFHESENRVEIDWNDGHEGDLNGPERGPLENEDYTSQEMSENREWKRSLEPSENGDDDSQPSTWAVNVPVSIVEYDTVDEASLLETYRTPAPEQSLTSPKPYIRISLLHSDAVTSAFNSGELLGPLGYFGNSTFIDGLGLMNMNSSSSSTLSATTCAPTGEWELIESPIRLALLILLSLFNAYIILGNVLVVLGVCYVMFFQ